MTVLATSCQNRRVKLCVAQKRKLLVLPQKACLWGCPILHITLNTRTSRQQTSPNRHTLKQLPSCTYLWSLHLWTGFDAILLPHHANLHSLFQCRIYLASKTHQLTNSQWEAHTNYLLWDSLLELLLELDDRHVNTRKKTATALKHEPCLASILPRRRLWTGLVLAKKSSICLNAKIRTARNPHFDAPDDSLLWMLFDNRARLLLY